MNNTSETAKIYLARHCKTIWNIEKRLVGPTDLPLCEEGIAEAKATAPKIRELGIHRIVCSPLKRALETSEIYADRLGVPLEVSPGLREIDHGRWNGQFWSELLDNDPDFRQWLDDPTTVQIPEGTESIPDAQKRVVQTIWEIALKYPGETVLVVMHKHIRSLLTCALYDMNLKHFRENINESVEPIEIPKERIQRVCESC